MKFQSTKLAGVFILEIDRIADERGFFARSWCNRLAAEAGIKKQVVQENISFNERAGTVRGMHFQRAPSAEAKVVRCTSGAIHDVIVDLREGSSSYLDNIAVELTEENRRAVFIDEGCAHGFQTLADATEVHYMMMNYYDPGAASGIRHDDPQIDVRWPLPVTEISTKDQQWPLLESD